MKWEKRTAAPVHGVDEDANRADVLRAVPLLDFQVGMKARRLNDVMLGGELVRRGAQGIRRKTDQVCAECPQVSVLLANGGWFEANDGDGTMTLLQLYSAAGLEVND